MPLYLSSINLNTTAVVTPTGTTGGTQSTLLDNLATIDLSDLSLEWDDYSIDGTYGIDFLVGTEGADVINGFYGADVLVGLGGNDVIWGDGTDSGYSRGNNDDQLFGGDGNDQLHGQLGTDWIKGDAGDDNLFGGTGTDRLEGGDGIDRLHGGRGADDLIGGQGRDTFMIGSADLAAGYTGAMRDNIMDFQTGIYRDVLDISQVMDLTTFTGTTYGQALRADYLHVIQHGTPGSADFHSTLYVDFDGAANGRNAVAIAEFDHVSSYELIVKSDVIV